jgi:hypothetical protein
MSGYLYVLGNDAMPGIIKIGKTRRTPADRARELSVSTGVPLPFKVLISARFENEGAAERECHKAFASSRVSTAREFFRSGVMGAYGQLSMMTAEITFTPEGEAELQRELDEVDRSFAAWIAQNRDSPEHAEFIAEWEAA